MQHLLLEANAARRRKRKSSNERLKEKVQSILTIMGMKTIKRNLKRQG